MFHRLKRLTIALLFLVAPAALAAQANCPPSPDEGPAGELRCGHYLCKQLVRYTVWIDGQCQAVAAPYVCCEPRLPQPVEGATLPDSLPLWLIRPNGEAFNYLPGAVWLMGENGLVLRGTYRAGVFRWENGTESRDAMTCSSGPSCG